MPEGRQGRAGAGLRRADSRRRAGELGLSHVSDLPALLKGTYFSNRTRTLPVAGPSGAGAFPGLHEILERFFFAPQTGAFRYLSWLMDDGRGRFSLEPVMVEAEPRRATVVWEHDGLRVTAVGVHHEPVPALAYRVDHGGRSVVFSGDRSSRNPHFTEFAKGPDLLVLPHAVPEDTSEAAANLHARPSELAQIDADAEPKRVILSHHMARSLSAAEASQRTVAATFDGDVEIAQDLGCHVVY